MFLAEYQAKELLAQYGVRIPPGALARSAEEAEARARALDCTKFAVKAQIHAGGRGLAGGVKIAATPRAVRDHAAGMLGKRLVTAQTGPGGETVERVYVEAAIDDSRSVYLAFLVDELSARPVLAGSARGGVAFETEAEKRPEIIETLPLPRDGDLSGVDMAPFLERIGVTGPAADSVRAIAAAMVKAAFETDAMLIEINPLVITSAGEAVAVDAKMVIDASARFRHPEFDSFEQEAVMDPHERTARDNEINFMRLGGDIGLVVNGAGLGLATNDAVIEAGGRPANFMDIRTTAKSFHIAKGVQLLLEDPNVKVILVNVHGGGMTVCDTIAEGVSFAYSKARRRPPIVFRAAGQNADWARTIMKERKLPFETSETMTRAAARAVEIARKGGRL